MNSNIFKIEVKKLTIVYIYNGLLYVDSTSLSTITLFDKFVDLTICRLHTLNTIIVSENVLASDNLDCL